MSILIRNMEMPESCNECLMSISAEACVVTGNIIPHFWERLDRPPHCPLIELPPHGRLIDADEFLKRAIGTKCFRGDFALLLEELVGESTTIIEADDTRTPTEVMLDIADDVMMGESEGYNG